MKIRYDILRCQTNEKLESTQVLDYFENILELDKDLKESICPFMPFISHNSEKMAYLTQTGHTLSA